MGQASDDQDRAAPTEEDDTWGGRQGQPTNVQRAEVQDDQEKAKSVSRTNAQAGATTLTGPRQTRPERLGRLHIVRG